MPKPCKCCDKCEESCDINENTECNNLIDNDSGIVAEANAENSSCKCRCQTEIETVSDAICEESGENCDTSVRPDTCTVKLYLESETNDSPENLKGPFMILEHVQRMAQDLSVPSHYLPTYQEYINEFPDTSICV